MTFYRGTRVRLKDQPTRGAGFVVYKAASGKYYCQFIAIEGEFDASQLELANSRLCPECGSEHVVIQTDYSQCVWTGRMIPSKWGGEQREYADAKQYYCLCCDCGHQTIFRTSPFEVIDDIAARHWMTKKKQVKHDHQSENS